MGTSQLIANHWLVCNPFSGISGCLIDSISANLAPLGTGASLAITTKKAITKAYNLRLLTPAVALLFSRVILITERTDLVQYLSYGLPRI